MKKILTIALILLCLGLAAKTEKLDVSGDVITLEFDNVKVKSIKFYGGDDVVVKYPDEDVYIENDKKKISFTAEFDANISLKLPENLEYRLERDDAVAKFGVDYFVVHGDEGEVVTFKDGGLQVIGDQNEKVLITDEGIYVEDEDEIVEISKDGIKVKNDTEDEEYTGFWGKLAGSIVRSIANASINYASKRPEKIAKWMINEDDNYEGNVSIDWSSDDDDEDTDKQVKTILKTFKMKAGEEISLKNINGNVTIETADIDEAVCDIEMKTRYGVAEFEKLMIDFDTSKGLRVETIKLENKVRVSVNYKITVPKTVVIANAASSNGSIKIEGAKILGDIVSSNGYIKLIDCKGETDISTSNGEVVVDDFRGVVKASTTNGRVSAIDVTEHLELYSSNGSITVKDSPYLQSATTGNARITVSLNEIHNDLTLRTSNGSISLTVDPSLDIKFDASTSNGGIRVEDLKMDINSQTSNHLKATLNQGSYDVDLSTSNGKININGDEKLY